MTADQPREFTAASIGAAVAAAVGAFVSIGPIVVSTFGIFLTAFTRQYGWSRTAFSAAILICALVGALVTPFAGRIVDRWGVRRVMLPAVALFGLALMSVTLVRDQLWQFYFFYVLVGVTAGFQNMVAYSKVASMWFHRHRGRVLSLVSVCYGAGYAVIPKAVQPLVAQHGWRAGYLLLGGMVFVSLLVLVPLLRLPTEQVAIGRVPAGQEGPSAAAAPLQDLTPTAARRTATFWIILLVMVLGVTSLVGTVAHLFPMLMDRGLSARFATTTLAMFALGGIVGQLSYGVLVDRVNSPRVALPFFAAALIGVSIIHYGVSSASLWPGALLMGIGQGSELGLAAYFTGRYFGLSNMGEIYGYAYSAATVASGLGPLLMGYVYDRSGSYGPMLLAFQAALALALVAIALLGPYVFEARRGAPAK